MIVAVEKVSKCQCHGKQCSICDRAAAIRRVYTQSKEEYDSGYKNIAFYFCAACGERFSDKLKVYST